MGTTRSYACTTQAGLPQLGSKMMRTSRGALLVRTRRATLASLPPGRGAFTGRPTLERCPQKPVIIPRSQLCSWNARRELYQKVGNFVGSVVSPILANVSLHDALDLWFEHVVKKHSKGAVSLYRYADDFVCVAQYKEDAERFYRALPQRLSLFNLHVAEDKTRMMSCRRVQPGTSFDFLGFTFRWERSRQGKSVVTCRTSRQKFRRAMVNFTEWCRTHRSMPLKKLFRALNAKLRGYYNYYGLIGNYDSLNAFLTHVMTLLWKWLNRRSQRRSYTWERFEALLKRQQIERPRITDIPQHQLVFSFARR